MEPPDIRYVRSGDADIAYYVIGEGPSDLAFVPFTVSSVFAWQQPVFRDFCAKLGGLLLGCTGSASKRAVQHQGGRSFRIGRSEESAHLGSDSPRSSPARASRGAPIRSARSPTRR